MPTVASIANLQSRLSAITLAQMGSDNEVDTSTLAAALAVLGDATVISNIETIIDDAEETLFSIIRGCVDVTDPAMFGEMRPWICKIAIYYLHQRHRGEAPEYIAMEYNQALQWGYKVQKGEVLFQREPQAASSKIRSTDGPSTTSFGAFNDTSFAGWSMGS